MRIAVASGKGGTGKTTIAVNLALSIATSSCAERPADVKFLDCDVEEPNAAIFLKPTLEHEQDVGLMTPEVDLDLCTYCGRCGEVCAYHAIAVLGEQVLVFPQLCHGCGSCTTNCPEGAIREVLRPTGTVSWGSIPETDIFFGQGEMNVGEAMATPIIREMKHRFITDEDQEVVILDAPPGNACPVVETLRGVDFALLVTEPTPFGLHDLRLAVELATVELNLPVGVAINRDGIGDTGVERFCEEAGIPILMRIPMDRRIAEAYADGITLIRAQPDYRDAFAALYRQISQIVTAEVARAR
jgi:MinD superfamily P-loop ATPase